MKFLVIVLCYFGLSVAASVDFNGPRIPNTLADSINESFECTLCKALITLADDFLQENGTEEYVEKFFEGICSNFPDTTREECKEFVKTYYPTIVQLLVARIQPDDICQKLKICTNTRADSKEVAMGSIECNLCEAVVAEVDKLLQENKTKEEIVKALEAACSILPGNTCKSLVDQYLPNIIDFIANNVLQPHAVCKVLGLCSDTDTKLKSKKLALGSIECDICEAAMAELDKLLKENSTEAEIQKALEDVCNLLPGDIGSTCKTLVDQYLPEIIDLLVNKGLKPDAVCKAIGLCTGVKRRRGFSPCKNATDCSQQFQCPYGATCIHEASKAFGACACLLPAGRRNVGSNDLSSVVLARPIRTTCMWDYNCRGVYCPTGSYPYCPSDHGLAASTCRCKQHH